MGGSSGGGIPKVGVHLEKQEKGKATNEVEEWE